MSSKEMMRIAHKIPDVHVLAAHFNMSNDLDIIKADHPNKTMYQRFVFLKQWHNNGGNRPELAQALNETGNSILATQ